MRAVDPTQKDREVTARNRNVPDETCPICELPLGAKKRRLNSDWELINCSRCGEFLLTDFAKVKLSELLPRKPEARLLLSHTMWNMRESNPRPRLDTSVCERIVTTGTLPTVAEQIDILVHIVGNASPGPGEEAQIDIPSFVAKVGAKSELGLQFVLQSAHKKGLVQQHQTAAGNFERVVLTFDGWQRFEDLRRGAPIGRRAFWASKFGDTKLEAFLNLHVRPAVTATGFVLRRLDDEPSAGLIDDRLRVEIRSARFLIVDLTHDNSGAYWEAGYGEGLGKPVIYTCEQSKFDEKSSHFDTNHHLTVMWTSEDPSAAVRNLKATIRATIPEAKQEDG